MNEFVSQFKIGYYLVVSNDNGGVLGFKLPANGIYTISAVGIGSITVKKKLINNPNYNWLIVSIDFTTLRDNINNWKVFDRKINKNMVKQLYG